MTSPFVTVDRRGDVRLKVGCNHDGNDLEWQQSEFLACSRTLARASPVFDRMLYGPYAEATHDNSADWIVRLPDDKPFPLQVFLNIAHANFAMVPKVLSVDNLYDLAALTNYYDATLLLSPWIQGWLASAAEIIRDANIILPRMLWVSWEFGCKESFSTVARRILMEARSPSPQSLDANEDDEIQAPYIIGKKEGGRDNEPYP